MCRQMFFSLIFQSINVFIAKIRHEYDSLLDDADLPESIWNYSHLQVLSKDIKYKLQGDGSL